MPRNSTPRLRAAKGQRPMPNPQTRVNEKGKITSYWVWTPTFTRDGKPDRERIVGKTLDQLRSNYEQWFIDNPDPSLAPHGRNTIEEFGTWWLDEIIKPGNLNTWTNYLGAFTNQICHPEYGCGFLVMGHTSKPEHKCNDENLQAWVRRMEKAGVSKPTRTVAIKVMRSMGVAMAKNPGRSGVRVSPCKHLEYPANAHGTKRGKKRHKASPEHARMLLAACQAQLPAHMGALWTFISGLGLRRGEVCGAQWSDFSDDFSTFTVNRQVIVASRQLQVTPAKNVDEDDEPDVLGISPPVAAALRKQKAAQNELRLSMGAKWGKAAAGEQRQPGDWVFTEDGLCLRPTRLEYLFDKIRKGAGVPGKTLHKGRHDFASFLHAMGAAPDQIQKAMRHRDAQTMYRYYIDPVERPNETVGLMDKLFTALAEPDAVAV